MRTRPLLLAILIFTAGCVSQASIEYILPFENFSLFRYYSQDNQSIAVEFFDASSFDLYSNLLYKFEKSSEGYSLEISIYDREPLDADTNKRNEDKRIGFNSENNSYFYINTGKINPSELKVYYKDDKGLHSIPYAGILKQPFQERIIQPFVDPLTGVEIGKAKSSP